jgi:hypothetical protein
MDKNSYIIIIPVNMKFWKISLILDIKRFVLFYPFQLGHEPIPAKLGTNIFGKEYYYYPNILKYG